MNPLQTKCSHNSWFSFKKCVTFDHISESLLCLSQWNIPVTVVIDSAPKFGSSFNLFRVSFTNWQQTSNFSPINSSTLLLGWWAWSWHSWATHLASSHSTRCCSRSCFLSCGVCLHVFFKFVLFNFLLFLNLTLYVLVSFKQFIVLSFS